VHLAVLAVGSRYSESSPILLLSVSMKRSTLTRSAASSTRSARPASRDLQQPRRPVYSRPPLPPRSPRPPHERDRRARLQHDPRPPPPGQFPRWDRPTSSGLGASLFLSLIDEDFSQLLSLLLTTASRAQLYSGVAHGLCIDCASTAFSNLGPALALTPSTPAVGLHLDPPADDPMSIEMREVRRKLLCVPLALLRPPRPPSSRRS